MEINKAFIKKLNNHVRNLSNLEKVELLCKIMGSGEVLGKFFIKNKENEIIIVHIPSCEWVSLKHKCKNIKWINNDKNDNS